MCLDPEMGGGTAERTFQMSRFLTKRGVKCTILTTDLGLKEKQRNALEGTKIFALPCLVKRFYIPRFKIREIKSLIEENDIVHLMGHWTFINALVYFITVKLMKPYVVCPAGALPVYGRSKLLKRIYNLTVGKNIMRNAGGHIAVTFDEIAQFQPYGIPDKCVSVIPNGIDEENYLSRDDDNFRRKYNLGDHPFLLFMGRLNSIKGPDLLIHAFCRLKDRFPEYHLVFAGPDEGMLSMLKDIAYSHKLEDKVHFTGYLAGVDKSNAYHAANLLVIPSRQEAMSIVVLEAGVAGTPVLITDQCGMNEIESIQGGKVVPASVDGLQAGLMEMLTDTKSLKSMGFNLGKFVRDRYLWHVVIDKYIQLYNQILTTADKK